MKNNLYRKKPIIVKAYDFSETKVDENGQPLYDEMEGSHYCINTLEGKMIIGNDSFVIFGINNEKYPCEREIFFKTYEKINEN